MASLNLGAAFQRWEAASYGGPDALVLSRASVPALKPDEVLLRVLATDATYTDLLILRGSYFPRFPVPGLTPGYACIGEVAAAGAAAPAALQRLGALVLAMPQRGCAAEFAALPWRVCVPITEERLAAALRAAPAPAAALPLTGVTAYQMLHRVAGAERLRAPGAALLIHGAAGGTGAMLVQLAKLAGVDPARIVGTCRARNAAAVRALGAVAVAYDDAGGWEGPARAAAPNGFAAVFDAVASAEYYAAGLRLLARGGIYVAYGFTSAATPGRFSLAGAVARFASFACRGCVLSCCDGKRALFYNVAARRDEAPGEYADDVLALAALLASGQLDVAVGRVWPFSDVPEALRAIESGRHTGKQIIAVAGGAAAAMAPPPAAGS